MSSSQQSPLGRRNKSIPRMVIFLLFIPSLLFNVATMRSSLSKSSRSLSDEETAYLDYPILERPQRSSSSSSSASQLASPSHYMNHHSRPPPGTAATKLLPNVKGSHLSPSNNDKAQVQYMMVEHINEAFSASWWAPLSSFLQYKDVEIVSSSPEGASFEMFNANIDRIKMTKDWLDFSVEHMSKWWKLVEHNDSALDRVIQILTNYTTSRRRLVGHGRSTDVPQQTLVVIAYQPYDQTELTKWSLAATIASHVSVGMGRIVVSGRLPEEEELVEEAFDMVKNQFQLDSSTELSFCLAMNEKTNDEYHEFNIPKSALKKLRHVFLGNANEDIGCWLGEASAMIRKANATQVVDSRWKYIFLTEPDTLLATRSSSLDALGEALEQGYVLAPYRLQPIPHGSDFKGLEVANDTSSIIPAVEAFEHVYEVDSNNMSCCDAGGFKPMTIFEPYDNFWWMSGFSKASTMPIEVAHKHLLLYPFMRLKHGTNVVLIAGTEHGKRCNLHFGASMC